MKPKMATVNAPFCKNPKNDNKMHFRDIRQVLTVLGRYLPYLRRHVPNSIFVTQNCVMWLTAARCQHQEYALSCSMSSNNITAQAGNTACDNAFSCLCTVRYFIIGDVRVGFWLDVWGFRPCIFDVDRYTWYRCFFWHIHTFWRSTTFIWFRYR